MVREDEISDTPHVPNTNDKDGESGKDEFTHIPPAPYPHRLRSPKKMNNHSEIYELFKQVKLNIPLLDAIKKIPSYAKFLKDLCTVKRKLGVNKEAFMTEQSTSLIRNNLPPKYKDPGSPTIFIVVGNSKLGHALVDLGASVNLLPYSVYVDLGFGELEQTNITLQLADRSVKIPRGIVKDVLVQVDKFYFPVDFVVLDTQPVVNQGTQFPVILGRPFLATANAIIHCRGGLMTLSFGNMTVNLNIFNVIKGMGDEEDMCEINMVDSVVQKYLDNVSHDDPLKSCLVSPSWDEEVTTLESEFLHSIIEHKDVLEVNGWKPKFETLPPNEDKTLPSEERPPKLELKPLPTHLKYAFLGEEDTFPVIISSSLDLTQETQLLEILKTHRIALGWTIADIKGISPLICTHRIHLEEDVKPSRQPQRRLNPIMKEVVKKEVLKLLDVGVIYPIADSKWVSPTQVVPKKSGVTVVANENNELIPTCVTSGWRVCIDYRKLNAGTRKDQKVLNDQTNQRIAAFESSVNRNLSNIYAAISRLSNQFVHQEEENLEEESQEEESLTETVLVEQAQLQPQEELKVESLEAPEELQDALVNFWPWTKEKEITALLTEKSSEHEGTQEPIIQPNPQAIPIDLDTIATAQATKNPLPTAPSTDQVYILPASQSQHKTPAAPKAKSNPLHVVQNFKELVASVHALATTSKTMATAYIAWHSGWFGCGFGFGTPGPRHF